MAEVPKGSRQHRLAKGPHKPTCDTCSISSKSLLKHFDLDFLQLAWPGGWVVGLWKRGSSTVRQENAFVASIIGLPHSCVNTCCKLQQELHTPESFARKFLLASQFLWPATLMPLPSPKKSHILSPISLFYTPQVSKATWSHFLVEKQTAVATPMMTRFLVPKQCNFTSKEVRLKAPILWKSKPLKGNPKRTHVKNHRGRYFHLPIGQEKKNRLVTSN